MELQSDWTTAGATDIQGKKMHSSSSETANCNLSIQAKLPRRHKWLLLNPVDTYVCYHRSRLTYFFLFFLVTIIFSVFALYCCGN